VQCCALWRRHIDLQHPSAVSRGPTSWQIVQTAARLPTCAWNLLPCHALRTRLLRSLPKLDSNTAQQLAAFLSEAQQHSSTGANPGSHQGGTSPSTAEATQEAAASLSEEEQQWWQQASLAYSLLKQQAGKVQQGQEQQEVESQQA
jgi:hypothetical protein